MKPVYIFDAIRTPIGNFGGSLRDIRADDLATIPLIKLMERNPKTDWEQVEDVILGCANQAGEDNRNIARMALLLAGLPTSIGGETINRLCERANPGSARILITNFASERTAAARLLIRNRTRAPLLISKEYLRTFWQRLNIRKLLSCARTVLICF